MEPRNRKKKIFIFRSTFFALSLVILMTFFNFSSSTIADSSSTSSTSLARSLNNGSNPFWETELFHIAWEAMEEGKYATSTSLAGYLIENTQKPYNIASYNFLLGQIYFSKNNYPTALSYIKKAENIYETHNKYFDQINCRLVEIKILLLSQNHKNAFHLLSETDKLISHQENSLELGIFQTTARGLLKYTWSEYYFLLGNHSKSKKQIEKAIDHFRNSSNQSALLEAELSGLYLDALITDELPNTSKINQLITASFSSNIKLRDYHMHFLSLLIGHSSDSQKIFGIKERRLIQSISKSNNVFIRELLQKIRKGNQNEN